MKDYLCLKGYLINICDALIHLSNQKTRDGELGLVHRDLKPSNILIINNIAKLADFGLAGKQGYTPLFCAPEQTDVSIPLTPLTDIHGLGVTLLLTQFEKKSALSLLFEPKRSLPAITLPPDTLRVLEFGNLMVNQDPGDRPDIHHVKAHLEKSIIHERLDLFSSAECGKWLVNNGTYERSSFNAFGNWPIKSKSYVTDPSSNHFQGESMLCWAFAIVTVVKKAILKEYEFLKDSISSSVSNKWSEPIMSFVQDLSRNDQMTRELSSLVVPRCQKLTRLDKSDKMAQRSSVESKLDEKLIIVKYFIGALNKLCYESFLKVAGIWRLPSINKISMAFNKILEEDGWDSTRSFSYKKIKHPKGSGDKMTFVKALDSNYFLLCTLLRSNGDCHAVAIVSHDEDFYFCKNTRSRVTTKTAIPQKCISKFLQKFVCGHTFDALSSSGFA